MTAMYPQSILDDPCVEAKAEVERTLLQIMSAARRRAVDELESYHAFGPKFTKFDDFEPLGRQDAEATRRHEREAIIGVKEFAPDVVDLKVDVSGPAAVATFVLGYHVVTQDDQQMSLRARSTMVFAYDNDRWLIVHEHFSPFTSNA